MSDQPGIDRGVTHVALAVTDLDASLAPRLGGGYGHFGRAFGLIVEAAP